MEEQERNYSELLETVSTSHRSFVNPENMNEFAYERTYASPIDKRPIHVFTHEYNGSSVHLEDDGQLYTSFGPTVDENAVYTPRERGQMTESMEKLVAIRGGDEGDVDVLDHQPTPTMSTFETPDDATEPAVFVADDAAAVDQADETETKPTR